MSQKSMKHARVRRTLRGGAVALGAAAVGIGVFAAPASAAQHDWSGVAVCESGGNWSINTGNGYYGGLQFSSSTWLGYGGGSYAARADLATSAQQIEIAERVLAGQGVGAWPTCGKRLTGGSTPVRSIPAAAPPAAAPAAAGSSSDGTYTVRSGDTMAEIAAAHGRSWRELHALNRSTVSNPDMIYVGQQLAV
ncbi:MAG TPA: transglycosylase family protein [Modestobacter sp.]|jgi:LysM repeat protein|nr:transglycosylase family protein [Modestobacter sp.]